MQFISWAKILDLWVEEQKHLLDQAGCFIASKCKYLLLLLLVLVLLVWLYFWGKNILLKYRFYPRVIFGHNLKVSHRRHVYDCRLVSIISYRICGCGYDLFSYYISLA
jgi:hypothetical protein